MSTTIGTTIAGTISAATGDSTQGHLFWAVNDAAWWLIYQASGDTTHLLTFRSPDGTTWTAKNSLTVTTLTADSRLFAVAYKNISSTDVVHVFHCHSTNSQRHTRATISGAQITWGADNSIGTQVGATNPTGAGCAITGDGHIVDTYNENGDVSSYLSTNADAGSSWTTGFGTNLATDTSIANVSFQSIPVACDTASKVVVIYDNGGNATAATSSTNFLAKSRSGATLAPVVGTAGISVFTAFTARSSNSYGVARVDDTHVHVVAVTGSNTLVHKIVNANGAGNPSISSGAAITNQTVKAGTGVGLVTDGTNVYALIIDSDAPNTVRYCKYNGTSWGSWTAVETTTKTRNFLTAAISSDGQTIIAGWSETNGSNFDIVTATVSLSAGTTITPTAGSLSLTGVAAVLGLGLTLGAGALSLTGAAPGRAQGPLFTPTAASLSLTGTAPTLIQGTVTTPGAGSVTFTGSAPGLDLRIQPGAGAIAFTGAAPSLSQGTVTTPTAGSLALTGSAPSLLFGTVRAPSAGSLSLSGSAPGLGLGMSPGAGSLALTGTAPTVSASASQSITPSAGSLSLSGASPGLSQGTVMVSGSGSLALTGSAPTLSQGTVLSPTGGALSFSGAAPTLGRGTVLVPVAGAMTLTGQAPVLGLGLQPGAGSLSLTGGTPGVALPGGVNPGSGSLTLTGAAPTLALGITPGAGSLSLTGSAPSVARGTVMVPGGGSLSLSSLAATLSFGTVLSPGAGPLAFVGGQPTVSVSASQNIMPGAGSLSFSGGVPVVTQGSGPTTWVSIGRSGSGDGTRFSGGKI